MNDIIRKAYKTKLCQCGCGKPTEPGRIFLNGHNRRKSLVTKTSVGYLMEYSPDHPNVDSSGKVAQHRLVLEKYLGRYLEPDEVPHHCNKKKGDNRIENIELMLIKGPESHNSIHKINNKNVLGKRWHLKVKRTYSDQVRQQISERKKKQHLEGRGGGFQKGNVLGKGRIRSEEERKRASERMKGNKINLGKKLSEETKKKISEKKKARDSKRKSIE